MKCISVRGLCLIVLCSMMFISCFDNDLFDRNKWSDRLEWKPDYTIPVGYITYNIDNFIKEEIGSFPLVNNIDYLAIKVEETNFFSFTIEEIVRTPQDAVNEKITGKILKDKGLELEEIIPIKVTKDIVVLESFRANDLEIFISQNPLDFPYDIEISFPGISGGNSELIFKKTVEAEEPLDQKIKFSGVDVKCSDSGKNNLDIKIKVELKEDSFSGDSFEMVFNTNIVRCSLKHVTGKFGNTKLAIPSKTLDFDGSIFDNIDIDNPCIKLIAKYNKMNIPFGVDADFIGKSLNGEEVVSIEPRSVLEYIGKSDNLESLDNSDKVEENQYDKTNSNIDLLFNPSITSIEYSGKVILNHLDATETNFISDETNMNMDMLMEVPILFKEEGITFDNNLMSIDLSSETTKRLEALSMNIMFLHDGYPLLFEIKKIFFRDKAGNLLDTYFIGDNTANREYIDINNDTSTSDVTKISDNMILDIYKDDDTKSKYIIPIPQRIIDILDEIKQVGFVIKMYPADRTKPIPCNLNIDMKVAFGVKLDLGKIKI